MDGAAPPTGRITIGSIFSIVSLVILVLCLGFLGALVWLMLQ